MAHLRERLILSVFKKKLRQWPVVSLVGPRQCGKTTFLRDLALGKKESTYVSFDRAKFRREAQKNPELFLAGVEKYPLVIDEAQKAPEIFDEIKAQVDERRIPGQFVLSGSTRFSKKVGIRESLTGRTATLQMDPLCIKETFADSSRAISLKDVFRYFRQGGMPGICFSHEVEMREAYWDEWLETTTNRDLKIFSKGKLSSDLAQEVIEVLARLEIPDASHLASKIKVDSRRVQNHLSALVDLMVIRELQPHPESGSGKALYFLFDTGLSTHFRAETQRSWGSWFLLEHSVKNLGAPRAESSVHYYRSRAGSVLDFVTRDGVHLFDDAPSPARSTLLKAEAAAKKFKSPVQIYCATDYGGEKPVKGVRLIPWSRVAAR